MTERERPEISRILAMCPGVRPCEIDCEDPDAFRARVFAIMPLVFFGCAGFARSSSLFLPKRSFRPRCVAVHVPAFAFLIFSLAEAANSLAPLLGRHRGLSRGRFVFMPLAQKHVFAEAGRR